MTLRGPLMMWVKKATFADNFDNLKVLMLMHRNEHQTTEEYCVEEVQNSNDNQTGTEVALEHSAHWLITEDASQTDDNYDECNATEQCTECVHTAFPSTNHPNFAGCVQSSFSLCQCGQASQTLEQEYGECQNACYGQQ